MEKLTELELFLVGNEAIGKFNLKEAPEAEKEVLAKKRNISKDDLETFIILDISGSMGGEVARICKHILPDFLEKMEYKKTDVIHFLMFETSVHYEKNTIEKIFSVPRKAMGGTNFEPALLKLSEILDQVTKKNIRILTLSDGEIFDQDSAVAFASEIASRIKGKFNINSQAIRYFTSSNQPDTRGLSSILQFSTNVTNLVDIPKDYKNEEIVDQIKMLFDKDIFASITKLESEFEIFKVTPFSKPEKTLYLQKGENIFWLEDKDKIKSLVGMYSSLTDSDLTLKDEPLELNKQNFNLEYLNIYLIHDDDSTKTKIKVKISSLNKNNFYNLLENKFAYFHQRSKILKILNSKEALEEIDTTIKYFQSLENLLDSKEILEELQNENAENDNNSNKAAKVQYISLKKRAEIMKRLISKKEKSFSFILSQIANDDKVNKLNSAQQAEYLRNLNTDKNAKSLARRAMQTGLDFDDIAREEVLKMKENFHEIENIDCSDHTISFYSNCTTFEGIKMLCELAKDENLIDSISCMDILKLINIVGIACDSPVGNFPDPMTWRVNELYAGCYTSISDILTVSELSNGNNNLQDYSTKKPIMNVIPFFEDERLHKFLKKYAPNILEYSASIGMRRIIANIPQSYNYTLVSGCMKMVEIVDKNKSDLNLKTFISLVKTYEFSIGNHFNHVLEHIREPEDYLTKKNLTFKSEKDKKNYIRSLSKLSFYIVNNGISNMFSVFIKLLKMNKLDKYSDKILRALFAFETYQIMRKVLKDQENPNDSAREKLIDILGINYDKYKTKLPELYEDEDKNVKFFNNYFVNETSFNKYVKSLWFIDYVCLLPDYLAAVYSDNPLENLRKVPKLTNEYILTKLKINDDNSKAKINSLSDIESDKSNNSIDIGSIDLNESVSSNFKNDEDETKENVNSNKFNLLQRFKFYNIVQSFFNHTKASRVDDEKEKMIIKDLLCMRLFEKQIRKYVQGCYKEKYFSELQIQRKTEKESMRDELILSLMEADLPEFKRLLKEGIRKGTQNLIINDSSNMGYMDLLNKFANPKEDVKLRFEKISISAYGYDTIDDKDKKEPLFNNGNSMRRDHFKIFRKLYLENNLDFKAIYTDIGGSLHIYRQLDNRHGHGNSKPSYWAIGYDTVTEMYSTVSKEEWEEYTKIHVDCCGLKNLKL